MNRQDEIDSSFLTTVNILATRFNCKITIDMENRSVEFDCPKETEAECAIELDKIYRNHLDNEVMI